MHSMLCHPQTFSSCHTLFCPPLESQEGNVTVHILNVTKRDQQHYKNYTLGLYCIQWWCLHKNFTVKFCHVMYRKITSSAVGNKADLCRYSMVKKNQFPYTIRPGNAEYYCLHLLFDEVWGHMLFTALIVMRIAHLIFQL